MADAWTFDEPPEDEDDVRPVLPRRPLREEAELDITPMIDCTFLLLIFFLVCSVPDVRAALELPPARHGVGVSEQQSLVISLAATGGKPDVFLADGRRGAPLSKSTEAQRTEIRDAVEAARLEGRTGVIIKAERSVLHADVARVAEIVGEVEGMQINLAVFEVP